MSRRTVMKLASRGKRFGAACIDMIIPLTASFISFIAFIIMLVADFRSSAFYGYGFGGPGLGYGYGYSSGPSAGVVTAFIISGIISLAFIIVQLILFNQSRTIGKAALGLQVVSSTDGEPVGFWKMLFREWFVKQASGAVFLLGYIWILIDEKNRGWHDKILDTYVVDIRESEALNSGTAYSSRSDAQRAERRDADSGYMDRPAPKSSPIVTPPPEKVRALSEAAPVEPAAGEPVIAEPVRDESVIELPGETVPAETESSDTCENASETISIDPGAEQASAPHSAAETAELTTEDE